MYGTCYLFHTFRLFLVGGRIELRRSDHTSASKQLLCNIRTDYAWLVRVTRLRFQTEYCNNLPFTSHIHTDVGLIMSRNVADFQIFRYMGLVAVCLAEKCWCYCFCNTMGWITEVVCRYIRRQNNIINDVYGHDILKPGTHYPHVAWAHIKLTFYFQLVPYPFPCVGSHMLISIIWWLGVI